MEHVEQLIVGAGVSGLAYANFTSGDYLILEADTEIGGYCKTVKKDGFVWDYSGHFFHFKRKEIETYLLERMPDDEVRVVQRDSRIRFGDGLIDFPFQKNIHQLPKEDFADCLYSLFFKHEDYPQDTKPANFGEMLYQKFGRGIADRFLIPYNEKLYACPLTDLDVDAMGRFFPYADLEDIIRNFKRPDNSSYNAAFTYPRGGAIQYVNALKSEVPDSHIAFGERLLSVDPKTKTAKTNKREISFTTLVSSAPFDQLIRMVGDSAPAGTLRSNKVLVFNLGFDRKGWPDVHWVYFPDPATSFYRVGFYDNIFGTDRLSLYVEIGLPSDAEVDVDGWRARVLEDLKANGVIGDHALVAEHNVVLDPAYVHITTESLALVAELRASLATRGIYSIGRYGGWTYCSIEDNIVEARELAERVNRFAAT